MNLKVYAAVSRPGLIVHSRWMVSSLVTAGHLAYDSVHKLLDAQSSFTPSTHPSFCVAGGQGSGGDIRRAFAPFVRDGVDGVTVLSVEPLLVRLHGFVSSEECSEIMEQASAGGGLAESTTWGGADAQDESNGLRSSSTTWIADCALPLLSGLTAKVSEMSGLPSTFMEKWQVRLARFE